MADKKRIQVDLGNNKIYTYRGELICEDEDFISLNDIKCGLVRIRKSNVVLIEVWGDDDGKTS